MKTIRICIVDEQSLIRHGLRTLINSDAQWQVVGEGATAENASALLATLRPDILLIEWTVLPAPATEALPLLAEKSPQTKIIALSNCEDLVTAQEALHAGAAAYLSKSAADSELLATLGAVADGRTIVSLRSDARSPGIPSPKGRDRSSGPAATAADLSAREREVLKFVAQGFTSAEISEKLFLSVKTIETYRARMMTKLKLRSRAELMEFVTQRSLSDSP